MYVIGYVYDVEFCHPNSLRSFTYDNGEVHKAFSVDLLRYTKYPAFISTHLRLSFDYHFSSIRRFRGGHAPFGAWVEFIPTLSHDGNASVVGLVYEVIGILYFENNNLMEARMRALTPFPHIAHLELPLTLHWLLLSSCLNI
jgi:hypothetical protein